MDGQIRYKGWEVANKAKEVETFEARVDSLKSDYADLNKLAHGGLKFRFKKNATKEWLETMVDE